MSQLKIRADRDLKLAHQPISNSVIGLTNHTLATLLVELEFSRNNYNVCECTLVTLEYSPCELERFLPEREAPRQADK